MTVIQPRRGTAAQWTTANPVLSTGESGFETDTKKWKYGDGTTAWNSLAYSTGGGEPPITAGTSSQYWRGDKSFQTLDKTAVGLGNADNTSDVNKPVSAAQQTALDGKQFVLNTTAVKTSAYTAAVSDLIPVDCSSGGVTITLPAAPVDKSRIVVKKVDSSTNAVTVSCGGSDVFNVASGVTSLSLLLQFQAIQLQYKVSGAIWYVVSTDVPLGGLDNRHGVLRRPVRNTVVALGDSITAVSNTNLYQPMMGESFATALCVESFQRLRWSGSYATAGFTLTDIQATHLPSVLALSPAPGACILMGGTNDVGNIGRAFSLSYSSGILKAIVASLLGAGIVPILVTLPPRTDGGNPNTIIWNTWLRRYATLNGYALIDFYTACVAADGTWKSGYNLNTIHPSSIGQKAAAVQALADGITDMFAPVGTTLTSRSTADLSTMFNNGTINQGMFTVDTNSDGIADGLTAGGSAYTASIVTPTTADELNGNWQQFSRTTGATGLAYLSKIFSSGWSVGDVLAISFRVQTSGLNTTGCYATGALNISTPGGFTTPSGTSVTSVYHGLYGWTSDTDGLVYVEAPIPAGATAVTWYQMLQDVTNPGTANLRIGELTIVNLTTGGLLV